MSASTRHAPIGLLIAAVAAGAMLATPATAAADDDVTEAVPVSVAYHPNMHGGAPMAIGESEGYFADEGLDVEPVRFTSGSPELDAMIAGQLDIGYLGPGAMPAVMLGEVELLTIDHPTATEFVIASEASGIDSAADLRGKEVLVAFGTSGEMVLREALTTAGLTWDDIVPVNSPDESSLAAYVAGSADAISVGPTFTNQAREQVPSNEVFASDSSEDFALPGVWIANKEFVVENRDIVDRFLRAFGKANDYRLEHLDTIVPQVAEYTGTPERDLRSQVELTEWWSTEQIVSATEDGRVATMLEGLNGRFQDTGKMPALADVASYFDADATTRAFGTESTGVAARAGDDGFSWVTAVLVVFFAVMLVLVALIIRRARS